MIKIILIITVFLIIECLSNPVNSDQGNFNNVFKQINDSKSSAYINMVFCSAKSLPWDCVKEESTRLLDTWMNNLYNQWELLKVEADSQMNSTLQKRGYSVNKFKEKPSNMINKIKTGTNYIGELVSQTIDELMGRDMEENYSPIGENDEQKSIEAVSPRGEKDGIVNQMKSDSQNGIIGLMSNSGHRANGFGALHGSSSSHESESIEHKHHGKVLLKRKKQNKKKKRKKFGKKKKKYPSTISVVNDENYGDISQNSNSEHQNELLDNDNWPDTNDQNQLNLLGLIDLLPDPPTNQKKMNIKKKGKPGKKKYGSRGKKKKKKKALVKLMLWGTIIKGKIELLLKILSAHLQIKFFLIALVGLLINIARFWIDIKKSHSPQKHTYEDHGDDWNSEGSYWKRSLNGANDINVGEVPSNKGSLLNSKDHIYLLPQASQNDPQYLAYREQIQR
ncbi:hypothetical protein ACFFRR_005460 [Megaselia abdita]